MGAEDTRSSAPCRAPKRSVQPAEVQREEVGVRRGEVGPRPERPDGRAHRLREEIHPAFAAHVVLASRSPGLGEQRHQLRCHERIGTFPGHRVRRRPVPRGGRSGGGARPGRRRPGARCRRCPRRHPATRSPLLGPSGEGRPGEESEGPDLLGGELALDPAGDVSGFHSEHVTCHAPRRARERKIRKDSTGRRVLVLGRGSVHRPSRGASPTPAGGVRRSLGYHAPR